MTSTDIRVETAKPEFPTRTGGDKSHTALLTVVGFDGTEPALAALAAATELIRGRAGHLEVVYVAHLPAYAGLSAPALLGIRQSLQDIADELAGVAHSVLDDREPRWHFQRRDGSVTEELVAAASELRHVHGPGAVIVIVVGASAHRIHHVAGSVAVGLAREAGFPLLVVPTEATPGSGRP